jgi:perosamine synthetase
MFLIIKTVNYEVLMGILTQKICESIRNVVGKDSFIPLHTPFFEETEEKYVVDCIRSNFVSSVGEYVDKFEKAIREYTKTKYAILTVNGTSALHICLLLTDVKKDDEVLVPSMTFVATPNAVWYIGAVPHFVDVNKESLGIDPFKLDEYLSKIAEVQENQCYNKKTHRQIKAIIPMHTFGHPVDMDELTSVAERYKLTIIEDAAEALGSLYKNKHVGNFSKMAILSFNGNKIITTGGGGAVLTNNEDLAKKVKHLTTTAKKPHPWEYVHDMVGYNYRMPALNASLGLAQIEKLDEFVEKKRILAEKYKESLKDVEEIEFFVEPGYARSNYWLNAIILNKEYADARDEILEETNKNGIMTRPVWKLMHKLEMFKDCPRMDLSVSESLEKRIINIPSSAHLIKD